MAFTKRESAAIQERQHRALLVITLVTGGSIPEEDGDMLTAEGDLRLRYCETCRRWYRPDYGEHFCKEE